MHSMVFSFIIVMAIASYLRTALIDPGYPPKNWHPSDNVYPMVEFDSVTGDYKYCRACKAYKPPRTEHCSDCNKCTVGHDHHCPWVANCVAHRNHKSFFLFLVYTEVACIYAIILLVWRLIALAATPIRQRATLDPTDSILIGCSMALILPTAIGVGALANFHAFLLSKNLTTHTFIAESPARHTARRERVTYRYLYDRGLWNNLYTKLGPSMAWWWYPDDASNWSSATDPEPYLPIEQVKEMAAAKKADIEKYRKLTEERERARMEKRAAAAAAAVEEEATDFSPNANASLLQSV